MKSNILLIWFLSLFFFIFPFSVYGANLQNASAKLSNARFYERSTLAIQFTTSSAIAVNENILITLPANPGFNIDEINSTAVVTSSTGCSNNWITKSIDRSGDTTQIEIQRINTPCQVGSTITVKIGNSLKKLVNPAPKSTHRKGVADIYGINIKTQSSSGEIIDEIIVKVAIIESVSTNVNVSTEVGGKKFVLFGYTSAKSMVFIDGKKIHSDTLSDETGYFQFNLPPILASSEFCLYSRDQFGRTSAPLCLPPMPTTFTANIGPAIIPPTISFDKSNYFMGDEVKLTGQTIPNSKINISFFVDEKKSFLGFLAKFSPILAVSAFTIPQLQIVSDQKGNFSLSLPSSTPEFFRLFAQTNYDEALSAESNILHLKILPIWFIVIEFMIGLLKLLSNHLLTIIILLQILVLIIFILRRYLHPHAISKIRALALRENESLILREHFDLLVEDLPLLKRDDSLLIKT